MQYRSESNPPKTRKSASPANLQSVMIGVRIGRFPVGSFQYPTLTTNPPAFQPPLINQ